MGIGGQIQRKISEAQRRFLTRATKSRGAAVSRYRTSIFMEKLRNPLSPQVEVQIISGAHH
ncbi:MAG: hypothetical protein DME20_03300 [Verrucomicrobia bacterium]|nr:MAG: hypothetical protein DME20_03300 [Verrucomicrobiota bacterium]